MPPGSLPDPHSRSKLPVMVTTLTLRENALLPRVSNDLAGPPAPKPAAMLQRATGEGRIAIDRTEGQNRLTTLRQAGAAKILCPRNHVDRVFEAVLLNTAGGLAGGDCLT